MQQTFVTNNFLETKKMGADFVKTLQGRNVLALQGDLGSGKTTFMQGFAEGLGITKKIISPTFIIMRTYNIEVENKDILFKTFYHVDMYRVESEKSIEGLGILEMMKDPQNIVAIEWPEKIKQFLPDNRIIVSFAYLEENKRQIIIE